MNAHCPLPASHRKATFARIYSELALHQAVIRVYSKPLFTWRKALGRSHDERTLYDFAADSLRNISQLHQQLTRRQFSYRPGIELKFNTNGKERTLYLYPWEERIVDLMLYRELTKYFHGVYEPSCYAYRMGSHGVDSCQHRVEALVRQMPRPLYFVKRDVADFFPTINHERLLELLADWIEPGDYLFTLLRQRIEFEVLHGEEVVTHRRGIAFGTAIACFFANLYLTPLDRRMNRLAGVKYFRYADDLLAFSNNRDSALRAGEVMGEAFEELRVASKPKAHRDFFFGRTAGHTDGAFEACDRFQHLGLEFRSDGSVGMAREKGRKIRNLFRFAFRRKQKRFRKTRQPMARAQLAVDIARDVVENGFRSVAIIDYYLKHVNDEAQLRELDRWLAEEILAVTFQNGHKKGNFRKLPFRRLRAMGLPSLRHRRRLLRHGHLESSFFQMRTENLIAQQQRRLPSARRETAATDSLQTGKHRQTKLVRESAPC